MNKLLVFTFVLFLSNGSPQDYIRYVNPFIGTSGYGHTFPGAVVPWGMVSVSPHNSPGAQSGYTYGSEYFYGFGHTHLSGTGCADLGSVIITASKIENISDDPEKYKMKYSDESATAGYYSLLMNDVNLIAEASVTARGSIIKFTSEEKGDRNIIFDIGKSLAVTGGGSVNILSDTEIEGRNISGGFCGETNRQTVYFAAKFSRPFSDKGIISSGNPIKKEKFNVLDSTLISWFRFSFDEGDTLIVKAGLSYTSTENAWKNLEHEISGWDINLVRKNAEDSWNNVLGRIHIETKNDSDKVKLYSALYHMLIHPNIINDVSGDYPLMGRTGIGNYKNRNRYTVFSLWDTYRTLHPFYTLVYPEIQSEILNTMVDTYKETGFLPKWELAGNETYMMVGDPAVPVIADSYIKGINDFDSGTAFEAILKPVILKKGESAPPVRAGYHELLEYKYIPFEQDWSTDWWVWGPVSTTQEYCFADWCISRFAGKMNNKKFQDEFFERSMYYKNLFDKSTMFFRPKMKNGTWLTPFDSLTLEGSGDWHWSGGPGYVEGNAWTYAWFVPHDVKGLIELYGGEDNFYNRLNKFFIDKHFTIGNEPDIHYPYLFREIKRKEYRTDEIIKEIRNKYFGTGSDGLPGDDDCGTISGWYVFSALGFYPVCLASEEYTIGTPLFDKAIIKLNQKYYKGKTIEIIRHSDTPSEIFLNDKKITDYKLNHFELTRGSKLIFK